MIITFEMIRMLPKLKSGGVLDCFYIDDSKKDYLNRH